MKTTYTILLLLSLFAMTIFAADERERTFEIKKHVTLIGGYPAQPKTGDIADPTVNKTILNGVLNSGAKVYHVVSVVAKKDSLNPAKAVVIEGVTIRGGQADQVLSPTAGINLFFPVSGAGVVGTNCTIELRKCTITNNSASSGGGVYFDNNVNSRIVDCVISDNAADDGAGVYADGGNSMIQGATFSQNKAIKSGGAFLLVDGSSTITASSFSGNVSGVLPLAKSIEGGGAIWNKGTLTVNASVFDGNQVTSEGEPVTKGGGAIANFGRLSSTGSTYRNNVATSSTGGAILCNTISTQLENCIFENNISTIWGGALLNNLNSSLTIKNCYFGENISIDKSGGAIYHKGSNLDIVNSTFFKNECRSTSYPGAGGIQVQGLTSIINSTIVGNKTLNGNGAGIKSLNTGTSTFADLTLTNSIVAFNYLATTVRDLEATQGKIQGINNIIGSSIVTGITNNLMNTKPFAIGSQNDRLFAQYKDNLPVVADNGGNTQTIALADVTNSLAVKAGVIGANIPKEDQRGYSRNAPPCIGAFELVDVTSLPTVKKNNVLFYPTITSDKIYLIEPGEVSVLSMSGVQLIHSNGSVSFLSINGLNQGIYIVKTDAGCGKLLVN